MDLKSFSDNNFDPKEWINQSWKTNKTKIDEEVFVTNMVNKLELYMKQLNHTIEETSNQVVSWIPRTIDEAKSVQSEGETIRCELVELEGQILAVEEQTGHSVMGLQRIHSLKSRLETAASALREADKWAQLMTQLEELLEDSAPSRGEKLNELINLVSEMTNSLEVLIDAPDFSKKRNQLQTMCDRLEATYSPYLIDALTQKNSETTRPYVRLFASMRRHSSLLHYWRRIEVTRLQSDERSRSQSDTLHCLLSHAQTQLEWLRDVLECATPLTELTRLYTEALLTLDPSPVKLLKSSLDRSATPSDAINLLCDLNARYGDFLKQYSNFVQSYRGKEKVPEDCLYDFSRTVCSPLNDLLTRYSELQARVLTDHLHELYKEEDFAEMCRLSRFSVERSAAWLDAAKVNARRIAGLSFSLYLTPAVEAFVSAHCSRLASNLRLLRVDEECLPAALSLTIAAGSLSLLLKQFDDSLQSEVKDIVAKAKTEEKSPWSVQTPALSESVVEQESALTAASDDVRRMCRTLKGYVLKIIFEPVALELEKVPNLKIWSENHSMAADLPDFSLSPQEYITQIGQYLLTLPQHIEPYLTDGQSGLAHAVGAQADHLSWYFVNEVCNQTCELYVNKIMSIKNMDTLGAKRCLTDIGDRNYGPPVDMWGAGCIMAEMWTRSPIMQGSTEQQQLVLISQLCGSCTPDVWPGVEQLDLYNKMDLPKGQKRKVRERLKPYVKDPYGCDLLDKLLTLDPAKRFDSDTALNHDFFWTDPMPCDLANMLAQHTQSMFEYLAPPRRPGHMRHNHHIAGPQPQRTAQDSGYQDRVF